MINGHTRTASQVSLNERLVFEEGASGRRGFDLPRLDVPSKDISRLIGSDRLRDDIPGMPELSEVDVIRHFTRLSTWNYHIDLGLYPLGSCTMKYNPKINERMARLDVVPWSIARILRAFVIGRPERGVSSRGC